MEVPRKGTKRVTSVVGLQANGGCGIVLGKRGLRPGALVNAEGDSIGGERGFLAVGRRAWHTATRREGRTDR